MAHSSGGAGARMSYRKFSDTFKSDPTGIPPAKVAKPAKVSPGDPTNQPLELPIGKTLASLATLAGAGVEGESIFAARRSADLKEWERGVRRLDIDRPPEGVPYDRWQTFVANAARFLAGPFAEPAAALGWTALDLFGCDSSRPFARIDHAGLLWLLNGVRLVALSANTATIKTRTGAVQTWRRRPSGQQNLVLAWELPAAG